MRERARLGEQWHRLPLWDRRVDLEAPVYDTTCLVPQPQTKLYKRCWIMLFICSAYSMSNSFMWLQYGIISNIFMRFYSIDSFSNNCLSMIYFLIYFPLMWLPGQPWPPGCGLDGLSLQLHRGLDQDGNDLPKHVCCHLLWPVCVLFGHDEVSTACSIGVLGKPGVSTFTHKVQMLLAIQLGIAIGFLVPPILVPNVDDMDELAYHISIMFYITAGMATVIFILVVFVFQEKPEIPPTLAQAQARNIPPEEYSYMASILRLLRNLPFMLLVISYGLNVGCFYAVSTLLNRMIIEHYPGEEVNAGRIGLTIVIAGMVGSIICGIWLDKTKTYKQTTLAVYLLSFVGMVVYAFTLNLGHLWVVFVTSAALGFFMTGYLPLGFEFAVELTFPECEGTSSGLLNCSAQIFGIIFTISQGKIIDHFGTFAGNIFLCVFLLIGTIMTAFIKSDLRRQKANHLAETQAASAAGSPSRVQDYGATAPSNPQEQQS
ncbi:unnamed protein product [Coregonus sp. 'balchen']|nr:unnamed protein product [Coregonus sp. 'balchen']